MGLYEQSQVADQQGKTFPHAIGGRPASASATLSG